MLLFGSNLVIAKVSRSTSQGIVSVDPEYNLDFDLEQYVPKQEPDLLNPWLLLP